MGEMTETGAVESALAGILAQAGMSESGGLDTAKLAFHPEVRAVCEENTCRSYDTCWVCPPAVGTVEECRGRCLAFGRMLLFSKAYTLEDSFDFEGMAFALDDFKKRVVEAAPALRERAGDVLILSNEGCGLCARCTWPSEPCRFPDRAFHSIEGYGLMVGELAAAAGVKYNNGPNTVTFFGAVLFDE